MILYTFGYCQTLDFTHYTVNEGLSHDITYKIDQDHQGYIYIGTDNGISKFNGYEFETILNNQGSNFITDVKVLKNQNLIFSTWGSGIFQYQSDSNSISPVFTYPNLKIPGLHLWSDSILIARNQWQSFSLHNLYSKKSETLFPLHNKDNIRLKPDSYANEPVKDNLWKSVEINIYRNKENLYLFSNYTQPKFKGIYSFNIKSNVCKRVYSFIDFPVHGVYFGKTVIASSYNRILFINEEEITQEIPISDLEHSIIYNVKQIENDLYFQHYNKTTGARKFSKYNIISHQLQSISDEIGIESMVSDFFIDKENNIWITTYGSGVYYLRTNKPNLFDNSILQETEINDFKWFNNHLIILTSNVLLVIKENTVIDRVNIPNNQESFQIDVNNQEILVLSKYPIKPRQIGPFTLKGIGSKQYAFQYDSTQIIINYNNINIQSPEGDTVFKHKRIERIERVEKVDSKLYVLWEYSGLFSYNLQNGRTDTLTKFMKSDYAQRYTDFEITTNQIYVGTTNGLFKISPTNTCVKVNDLLSPVINDLHLANNMLWIGSQKGLNYIHENEVFGLTKNDGISSTAISKITTDQQFLYTSGNKGLSKIPLKSVFKNTIHFHCSIRQNKSTFFVNKVNYLHPNSFKIEYSINKNKEWIHLPNSKQVLTLNQLKPGSYSIQFRYKDIHSSWMYSDVFSFYTPYPSYYWIIGCSGLFCLGLMIFFSIKNKINRQNHHSEKHQLQDELEHLKQNLAQDFHDELGNKIANISLLSSLLENELKKGKSKHKVQVINRASNELYTSVKNYIWLLNSDDLSFEEAIAYLQEFGETMFINHEIEFRHSIDSVDYNRLKDLNTKQLVLIFKEAMTNALKHSKTKVVELNLKRKETSICIECIDFGIGFKPENQSKNGGIENIKKRARILGMPVSISSNYTGTVIRLEINM
ncbi:MAG: histidine kinase [Flavobacteriales bacterium]